MRGEYVFVGPACAGKTTAARMVADRLGLPRVELDALQDGYLDACPGFDRATFDATLRSSHTDAVRYVEPAAAWSLERIVRDHRDCVFDLGAGHTCYLDQRHHCLVAAALAPFRRVVLLMPSTDIDRAIQMLRERSVRTRGEDWIRDGVDFIDHWVRSPQNRAVATIEIVTGERDPEQIADDVLRAGGSASGLWNTSPG